MNGKFCRIAYYNNQPVIFNDFIDVPELTDGEIELYCIAKKPAIPEKKWVPAYVFEIRGNSSRVGEIKPGWRKNEPSRIEKEVSTLFEQLVYRAINENEISMQRGAELLKIPYDEAVSRCCFNEVQ